VNFAPPEVIIRDMLTFDRAYEDFLGDCRRRGYSQRTLDTYRRTYEELADRLARDQDVSRIAPDDLRRYLATKARLAPGTVAGHEAHLSSLFKALYLDGKIARNPMDRLPRTRRRRPEDLDVKTVSSDDVRALMRAASSWPERLAVGVLVYLGPRRRAVARLRVDDWDRERGRIRFREKGGKVPWKRVPVELERLLEAAEAAGAFGESGYLVPPEGHLQRPGDRDDRVIWRLVKRVAARAGVDAHVHALRAAFAVFYLEQSTDPRALVALQEQLGHNSIETTRVYLRKLDRERALETFRPLSWGVAIGDDTGEPTMSQIAGFCLESSPVVGAGGFEPPSEDAQGKTLANQPTSLVDDLVARIETEREAAET